MNDVTRILSAAERGDARASEQLLPLVYDELRKLAAQRLAREQPGQTLEATALVHEAYLRLVDTDSAPSWNDRGHFFAAAAEAMRRILIERARRKQAAVHGGERRRIDLEAVPDLAAAAPRDLFDLDEAIDHLLRKDPICGQLVKLQCYAGLSIEEAGEALGLSPPRPIASGCSRGPGSARDSMATRRPEWPCIIPGVRGSDLTGTIAQPLNPVLAPLGNYGGPTQTMALLPGSPAIDAGTSGPGIPATDQRGLGRVGAVDIGAFESQGFTFTARPRQHPADVEDRHGVRQPARRDRDGQQPGRAGRTAASSASSPIARPMVPRRSSRPPRPSSPAARPPSPPRPTTSIGSYTVVASATGSSPAVSFALTNTGPVFASLVVNTTSDSLSPGAGLLSLR